MSSREHPKHDQAEALHHAVTECCWLARAWPLACAMSQLMPEIRVPGVRGVALRGGLDV